MDFGCREVAALLEHAAERLYCRAQLRIAEDASLLQIGTVEEGADLIFLQSAGIAPLGLDSRVDLGETAGDIPR